MKTHGWFAVFGIGLLLICEQATAQDLQLLRKGKRTSSPDVHSQQAVADAVNALMRPRYTGYIINQAVWLKWYHLPDIYRRTCDDAIDLLIRTPKRVDADLLKLATSDKRLRVRYRAVYVLAQRGNAAAVPLLNKMCASKDAAERYLAWHAYHRALGQGKLPHPADVRDHLALYAREKDDEIREQMEWFFGAARAKAAVAALVDRVNRDRACMAAVWALGEIGDKRAVPAIIKAHASDFNTHYHLQALGKLATPEAVDFLIEHLGQYGGPEALFESRSARALVALKRHLNKLKQQKKPDKINLAATRIAVIRLSQKDPREALLAIAENQQEDKDARGKAFQILRELDHRPYHRRILKLYRTDGSSDIRWCCIEILEDSTVAGVTEAMIDHALLEKKTYTFGDVSVEYSLTRALSKRLGLSTRDMNALRVRLRQLRKAK